LAYGDIAYQKLLKDRGELTRSALRKGFHLSEEQIEVRMTSAKQLKAVAEGKGCQSTRWHSRTFKSLVEAVRANLPPFAPRELAEVLFSTFVPTNGAIHGDALSLRTQYKELKYKPLEIKRAPYSNYLDVMGSTTLWAWQVVADYYVQTNWLNDFIETNLRGEIDKHIQAAKAENSRQILLPPWIADQRDAT
jgi:hypothetical protein